MPNLERPVIVSLPLLLALAGISCTGTALSPTVPSLSAIAPQGASVLETHTVDLGAAHRAVDNLDESQGVTNPLTPVINMKGTWVGGFTSAKPTPVRPCAYAGTMKSVTLVVTNQSGKRISGFMHFKALKKTAGPAYCRNYTNLLVGFGSNGVITGNKVKITDNNSTVWQLSLTGISNIGGLATGSVAGPQNALNGTVKLARIKL